MSMHDILKRHVNKIFIETGTGHGATTEIAYKLGYQRIYTIELHKKLARDAQEKFRSIKEIAVCCGDTLDILPRILKEINEKATFWLDGHFSDSGAIGKKKYPIEEELEIIGSHFIKNHIILIDDVRLFEKWGTSLNLIKNILRNINNGYKIYLQNKNNQFVKDMLVAEIPKEN